MGSSVVSADNETAIAILNQDGVVDRLKVTPQRIERGNTYLVNGRMLLVLMPIGGDSVEAHIAEPKAHWTHIHIDIEESLKFIQALGYNKVYTNVRNELQTTLNLLIKHGFNAVDVVQNEVILLWESKQHY